MTFRRLPLVLAATVILALSTLAQEHEHEKKIQRTDLPSAVDNAVAEQSTGATIKGYSEEKENGQTYYEAEMTVNGHSKDVLFDSNGSIVEVEEWVAVESLPADIRSALQAKAGDGKIAKVETIKKKGKLVAYEAKVMTNGKKSEIQVGPDGKPLNHEE